MSPSNEPTGPIRHFGATEVLQAGAFLAELAAQHERGLLVCGPSHEQPRGLASAVRSFADLSAWPVLADIGSPLRTGAGVEVVTRTEVMLRSPGFAGELDHAEVIVQLGGHHLSKALRLWAEQHRPTHTVLIDPAQQWLNPSFGLTAHITASHASLLVAAVEALGDLGVARRRSLWTSRWHDADAASSSAIEAHSALARGAQLDQPALAHHLLGAIPPDHILYVSNSMPIRDVDSFGHAPAQPIDVHVHRGANGIDGLISATAGAAVSTGKSATLYCGDLAFLHDIGGLITAAGLGVSLTIVVPDNNGGGIFSQLPIAGQLDAASFEEVFHTPHGLDLVEVASIGPVRAQRVSTFQAFTDAYAAAATAKGIDVIVVPIDHRHDRARRAGLHAAISSRVASNSV